MVKVIILILTLLFTLNDVSAAEYKVLRVLDGDTVFVDFNGNGKAEPDERVRVNEIGKLLHVDS